MEVVITHETGALDSVPVRATDHPLHFELRRHALLAPLGPATLWLSTSRCTWLRWFR